MDSSATAAIRRTDDAARRKTQSDATDRRPAGAITDQHAAPHDDPAIRRDPLTFLPSYRCLPRRPRRRILARAAAASRIT